MQITQVEYKKLVDLKDNNKLKPIEEFSREELKHLILNEFITNKQLMELFDITQYKLSNLKNEMKLTDRHLSIEHNSNVAVALVETTLESLERKIDKAFEFFVDKDNDNVEEIQELVINVISTYKKEMKETLSTTEFERIFS